ncbi:MAG: hypothetical protein H0W66_13280 [Chthoniobacterales bacterium]|nr:hypothetical protein [Chthoniobacterales bacterium]
MRKSKSSPRSGLDFAFRADEFVLVAGEPADFQVETGEPQTIDHVWITIQAGNFGRLRISINTWSLKHAADGFDPRMRVAVSARPWTRLPASGVFPACGLDYGELERAHAIVYREMDRPALEKMLRAQTDRAICVEAWGSLYLRDQLGVHQVHCRRASCSVRNDYVGRDGALRFYFPGQTAETILFKYCGQA